LGFYVKKFPIEYTSEYRNDLSLSPLSSSSSNFVMSVTSSENEGGRGRNEFLRKKRRLRECKVFPSLAFCSLCPESSHLSSLSLLNEHARVKDTLSVIAKSNFTRVANIFLALSNLASFPSLFSTLHVN